MAVNFVQDVSHCPKQYNRCYPSSPEGLRIQVAFGKSGGLPRFSSELLIRSLTVLQNLPRRQRHDGVSGVIVST